jgi:hypothetical protein
VKRVLRGKGSIEIELPYAQFSSGAKLAEEALKLAREWPARLEERPARLDLASYGVRREGEAVVFTFKRADAEPV